MRGAAKMWHTHTRHLRPSTLVEKLKRRNDSRVCQNLQRIWYEESMHEDDESINFSVYHRLLRGASSLDEHGQSGL